MISHVLSVFLWVRKIVTVKKTGRKKNVYPGQQNLKCTTVYIKKAGSIYNTSANTHYIQFNAPASIRILYAAQCYLHLFKFKILEFISIGT